MVTEAEAVRRPKTGTMMPGIKGEKMDPGTWMPWLRTKRVKSAWLRMPAQRLPMVEVIPYTQAQP